MEGYGDVQININTPIGKQLFKLKDVTYIPGFYTNVMSHRKLRQARYYWDDISLQIKRGSETVFNVNEIHE